MMFIAKIKGKLSSFLFYLKVHSAFGFVFTLVGVIDKRPSIPIEDEPPFVQFQSKIWMKKLF